MTKHQTTVHTVPVNTPEKGTKTNQKYTCCYLDSSSVNPDVAKDVNNMLKPYGKIPNSNMMCIAPLDLRVPQPDGKVGTASSFTNPKPGNKSTQSVNSETLNETNPCNDDSQTKASTEEVVADNYLKSSENNSGNLYSGMSTKDINGIFGRWVMDTLVIGAVLYGFGYERTGMESFKTGGMASAGVQLSDAVGIRNSLYNWRMNYGGNGNNQS